MPAPKETKRAVIIDLISDSDEDDEDIPNQNTKKSSSNILSPKKLQTTSINSTSESPELMIID